MFMESTPETGRQHQQPPAPIVSLSSSQLISSWQSGVLTPLQFQHQQQPIPPPAPPNYPHQIIGPPSSASPYHNFMAAAGVPPPPHAATATMYAAAFAAAAAAAAVSRPHSSMATLPPSYQHQQHIFSPLHPLSSTFHLHTQTVPPPSSSLLSSPEAIALVQQQQQHQAMPANLGNMNSSSTAVPPPSTITTTIGGERPPMLGSWFNPSSSSTVPLRTPAEAVTKIPQSTQPNKNIGGVLPPPPGFENSVAHLHALEVFL